MRVACPHCNSAFELAADAGAEATCPNCGSSVRLEQGSTAEWRPDTQGHRLGRFELVEVLGSGAFGTVYLARDPELERLVALKRPRGDGSVQGADLDRFLREARSVAQLRHPSIVTVHEVGSAAGLPFLVSDFVRGMTLADMLSGRRFSAEEAARLLLPIVDALAYAHAQGVVHRDVKPSNIMVDEAGTPHLMDFGLAKRDAGEITMTVEGQVLGTPAYMCPEQARGESHGVDGRSDVYSVGVVLYQLLTGELPFRGNTRMLLHQVLHDDPRSPRSLYDRVPRELENICLKAMAKEPERRYATAGELADDLRRFLRGEPVHARPVGPLARLWRWSRRNRAIAGLVLAVNLALLVGAGVSIHFALRADERAAAAAWNQQLATDNARRATEEEKLARLEERKALRQSAGLALERAMASCERDEISLGLLQLADSLRLACRAGDADLERVIRANLAGYLGTGKRLLLQEHVPHGGLLALSPDGRFLVDAGRDRTATLWDTTTGQAIGAPLLNASEMMRLDFSPDSRLVMIACKDGSVRLWECATGLPLGPALPLHSDWVQFRAFSPDSKMMVTHSPFDHSAVLWDPATGKLLGPPVKSLRGPVVTAAFHEHGCTVVEQGPDSFVLWQAQTAQPIGRPLAHDFSSGGAKVQYLLSLNPGTQLYTMQSGEKFLRGALASLDGRSVLLATDRRTMRVVSTALGEPIGAALVHPVNCLAAAFSKDGKRIATGCDDKMVRLWDTQSGRQLGMPLRHDAPVTRVEFTADDRTLVTGTSDRRVHLWNLATGAPRCEPLAITGDLASILFSPDGRMLVTESVTRVDAVRSTSHRYQLWNVLDGKASAFEHGGSVVKAAFSADGRTLYTAGGFGGLQRREATTGKILAPFTHHRSAIRSVAFAPDGRHFATGGDDAAVRLWDAVSGAQLGEPLSHGAEVRALKFSPDGANLWTASGKYNFTIKITEAQSQLVNRGEIRAWDVAGRKLLAGPLAHQRDLSALAFRPDGRAVVLSSDKHARLWEIGKKEAVCIFRHDDGFLAATAFSHDGSIVATGIASRQKGLCLWDAGQGQLKGEPLEAGPVRCLAFSRDGRLLLAGCGSRFTRTGYAQFWETATGRPTCSPLYHPDEVTAVAFSRDSSMALTGSRDGTAQLWRVPSGRPVGPPLIHPGAVEAVSFSPDGQAVLTRSEGRLVRLWDVASARPLGPPLQPLDPPTKPTAMGKLPASWVHVRPEDAVFSPDGRTILTGSSDGLARLWPLPIPLAGDPEQVLASIQVLTGLELDDHQQPRPLDLDAWQLRRRHGQTLLAGSAPTDLTGR